MNRSHAKTIEIVKVLRCRVKCTFSRCFLGMVKTKLEDVLFDAFLDGGGAWARVPEGRLRRHRRYGLRDGIQARRSNFLESKFGDLCPSFRAIKTESIIQTYKLL
ncbi:hypothetical protein NC651_019488 [Populus alba x Populus x berolinensis]|nr:hypothetical protein NC651_019488 [Populus alba x Populus x berolinensis]